MGSKLKVLSNEVAVTAFRINQDSITKFAVCFMIAVAIFNKDGRT